MMLLLKKKKKKKLASLMAQLKNLSQDPNSKEFDRGISVTV